MYVKEGKVVTLSIFSVICLHLEHTRAMSLFYWLLGVAAVILQIQALVLKAFVVQEVYCIPKIYLIATTMHLWHITI